ncbi:MAG: cupin domain-containing protein [Crocosphaera sp.]|nr:cupin domain-containing protein [Crocosphaera sp.]
MLSFKRLMISLFKIICLAMFGMLLILVQPNYAQAELAIAEQPPSIPLEPNTAYKVDRTPKLNRQSPCDGKTAQVKFIFNDPKFKKGVFEETYPIQDNWDLFFNTPDTEQELYFQDLTGCNLQPRPASLELLSGYKNKKQATELSGKAHFVVAKDYYAFPPDNGEPYQLGSLTAIGGTEFPALRGSAIGQLIIKPDSIRAPHWHLKYTETGYCYKGLGQVGIIMPGNTLPKGGEEEGFFGESRVEEFFVKKGEIFHFPEASQHYLRNVGNEDFECVLFFAEGQALTEDKLLTITLQNIVGGTPLGVLGPVLVTDQNVSKTDTPPIYTAQRVSEAPAQTYSSVDQGPEIVSVVETCGGTEPDPNDPGCPPRSEKESSVFSIYSTLKP